MASINNPFSHRGFSRLPLPAAHYNGADGRRAGLSVLRAAARQAQHDPRCLRGAAWCWCTARRRAARACMRAGAGLRCRRLCGLRAGHARHTALRAPRGTLPMVGQLEDDLDAFVARGEAQPAPATLVGFSSGGGFVLRFAGSARQQAIRQLPPALALPQPGRADPYRPGGGGWVSVGVPRIVGRLTVLGVGIGMHAFGTACRSRASRSTRTPRPFSHPVSTLYGYRQLPLPSTLRRGHSRRAPACRRHRRRGGRTLFHRHLNPSFARTARPGR